MRLPTSQAHTHTHTCARATYRIRFPGACPSAAKIVRHWTHQIPSPGVCPSPIGALGVPVRSPGASRMAYWMVDQIQVHPTWPARAPVHLSLELWSLLSGLRDGHLINNVRVHPKWPSGAKQARQARQAKQARLLVKWRTECYAT